MILQKPRGCIPSRMSGHILFLTTGYSNTGANKTQNDYCGRHQCSKGQRTLFF